MNGTRERTTVAVCAALLLLTSLTSLAPAAYADECTGLLNCTIEPTTTMSLGQTQTFNYQFCPQANYDFVSANATAFVQGVFITSQLWTYLGSVAAGGCLSGSFTISIPSNATAGSYEDDVVIYCYVTTSDGNSGYCSNDQAITYYPLMIAGSSTTTLQNVTVTIECTPTSIATQNDLASCSAKLSDNAINPTGTFTLSTNSSGGSFETGAGGNSCPIDSVTLQCSFSYTDTTPGTALITASYSGDNENAAATGTTTITVTAPTPTQCPALWLTEGLAPAASTTGDDNVYVTIHWAGQTPVSVELGAFASSPTIDVGFAFNPVTMQGPTISVLMNVMTSHTADGTYTISVAAQLTDPASNQPCSANMKVYVTVSGTTVFVGTLGDQQTTAIWVSGMPSPFMVSGNISASQYSNFTPTVDANGKLTSLAWSVTGPPNTTGQGTITIPKTLVTVGLGPVVLIDNIPVGITVTQDSSNYYITYTTRFSTHQVVLEFVTLGNTTTTTTSTSSTMTSTPVTTSSSSTTTATTTRTSSSTLTSSSSSTTTGSSTKASSQAATTLELALVGVVAVVLIVLGAMFFRRRHL